VHHDISKQFWGEIILSVNPLHVSDDCVNIKILLAEGSGVESGLHVTLPISSFAPQPRDKTFEELYRY
jgi:hypothetical protein